MQNHRKYFVRNQQAPFVRRCVLELSNQKFFLLCFFDMSVCIQNVDVDYTNTVYFAIIHCFNIIADNLIF